MSAFGSARCWMLPFATFAAFWSLLFYFSLKLLSEYSALCLVRVNSQHADGASIK